MSTTRKEGSAISRAALARRKYRIEPREKSHLGGRKEEIKTERIPPKVSTATYSPNSRRAHARAPNRESFSVKGSLRLEAFTFGPPEGESKQHDKQEVHPLTPKKKPSKDETKQSTVGFDVSPNSGKPLLARNTEVADEVAALLATVRRNRSRSPARNRLTTNQSSFDYGKKLSKSYMDEMFATSEETKIETRTFSQTTDFLEEETSTTVTVGFQAAATTKDLNPIAHSEGIGHRETSATKDSNPVTHSRGLEYSDNDADADGIRSPSRVRAVGGSTPKKDDNHDAKSRKSKSRLEFASYGFDQGGAPANPSRGIDRNGENASGTTTHADSENDIARRLYGFQRRASDNDVASRKHGEEDSTRPKSPEDQSSFTEANTNERDDSAPANVEYTVPKSPKHRFSLNETNGDTAAFPNRKSSVTNSPEHQLNFNETIEGAGDDAGLANRKSAVKKLTKHQLSSNGTNDVHNATLANRKSDMTPLPKYELSFNETNDGDDPAFMDSKSTATKKIHQSAHVRLREGNIEGRNYGTNQYNSSEETGDGAISLNRADLASARKKPQQQLFTRFAEHQADPATEKVDGVSDFLPDNSQAKYTPIKATSQVKKPAPKVASNRNDEQSSADPAQDSVKAGKLDISLVEDDVNGEEMLSPKQPPTIEELEPTVPYPQVTPACIADRATIVLRSHWSMRTLQIVDEQKGEDVDDSASRHTMSGYALAESDELLSLSIHESHMGRAESSQVPTVLCYGDRVVLRSAVHPNRLLGAMRRRYWEIGFAKKSLPAATEQWRVIRVDFKRAMRVGRSALERDTSVQQEATFTEPVQVGDPIALRNCHTGGILSLDPAKSSTKGGLTLISDSHDSSRVRHDNTEDPTLLGRLQRHDRLVPVPAEAFHFLAATVPPSPLWCTTRSLQRELHPFLKGSFFLTDMTRWERGQSTVSTSVKEPSSQESLLIDELLGSFLGVEGEFIRVAPSEEESGWSFHLLDPPDATFDQFLRRIVEDLLQLSRAYCNVRHYLGKHLPGYVYGCVVHGFCEKLDALLHEYVEFVSGVERSFRSQVGMNTLTLCNLQVTMRPATDAMVILDETTKAISAKKGGSLLNCLRTFMQLRYEGNSTASTLLQQLLAASAAPYLKILGDWLECGVLKDRHSEFMVKKNLETRVWENRYSVVHEHVVEALFPSPFVVDKVLAAGRYWHALQACNRAVLEKVPRPLNYFESTSTFATYVEANHQKASLALVELLLNKFDLLGSLRLMKRFFLLDHGDFFINFLDAAEDELRKDLDTISMGRIQYWLDIFIQNNDKSLEEGVRLAGVEFQHVTPTGLRCHFAQGSLAEQLDDHFATPGVETRDPWTPLRHTYGGQKSDNLTGLDTFLLGFQSIPFPITLILSKKALERYQLLFRHLFFAKYVERRLVGIWQDHQDMKELQALRHSMGPTFLLRQRMLHFVQNFIYYMMLEVIQPHWTEMEAEIANDEAMRGRTIDDIVEIHMRFLNRALEACLLTNKTLVRSLTKMMKTCLLFSDQMKLFMKATKISVDKHNVAHAKQREARRSLNVRRDNGRLSVDHKLLQKSIQESRAERRDRVQKQTSRVDREIRGESYPRMIARFDQVFSDSLKDFMVNLTSSDDLYHSQKVNLCIRLDYNGFVTQALGLSFSS